MDKLDTRPELDFYATEAVRNGWSRALLDCFIHQNLHVTQGSPASNFEVTVPEGSAVLKELARDPYRLDFLGLDKHHAAYALEDSIVANMVRFLTELGVGFAFVGRQYPVLIGGEEYRIDLLFYHLRDGPRRGAGRRRSVSSSEPATTRQRFSSHSTRATIHWHRDQLLDALPRRP